jgi:hypothetical protein
MMILMIWLLVSAVFPGGEDWPLFQHDTQHTGYSPSHMPESLKITWVSNPVCEHIIRTVYMVRTYEGII